MALRLIRVEDSLFPAIYNPLSGKMTSMQTGENSTR